MDLRGARGLLDLLVRRVGLREAEVLAHGRVEEVGLLRDDADGVRERRERQVADVDAVDRHRAARRVVEPSDEVRARRLARARLADERRLRAARDGERDVLERPGVLLVAEPDVVERDVAARPLDRVRPLDDVDGLVEILEDPVEERERALHLELHAEQAADREEEPGLEGREGDERADRDRVAAARDRPAGEEVDERGHHGERRLDRGHHPAARHPAPHLEPGEPLGLRLEADGEVVRAAHRLAEQDPGDRERLLDDRRDVRERRLPLGVTFLRWSPTRFVSQTKSGSSASANAASRQSSRIIAATVASTVVTLESTDVAVVVTTFSIPPMSFAIRLCTSPVRVRVKNASESRCRCR